MSAPSRLEELVEAGEKMRRAQKEYFTARRSSNHKLAIAILPESKRLEKEFDALIVTAKTEIEASLYISKSFKVLAEDPEAKP